MKEVYKNGMDSSGNSSKVGTIVETDLDAENGQSKCPK